MIDLHCHILPGIDDGPATLEGSLALGRAAVAAGITQTAATPHVNSRFQTTEADLESLPARVAEVNEALAQEAIPLTVVKGAEMALSRLPGLSAERLRPLCLGDGNCLLVESPYSDVAPFLDERLFALQAGGLQPVLAHPERCPLFQADPELLARLVANGTVCLLNAGSLDGSFGRTVRRTAIGFLRSGLMHAVSSDAHDHERRPPVLLAAIEQARDELPDLAGEVERLTSTAPAAILAGTPVPRAPRLLGRSGGRMSRLLRRR